MMRFPLIITALFSVLCANSQTVFADPDMSVVRAVIDEDSSNISVLGGTRVDVVTAVVVGLEKCQRRPEGVTIGSWLQLPKDEVQNPPLTITVFTGEAFEGGEKTAYIGVTPKAPFIFVTMITAELKECGFSHVRLLSDESIRNDIMPLVGKGDLAKPRK